MTKPIRWGILATGRIARMFAEGLEALDEAELVAVGSRSQESADAFGEAFGIPHRHGSYEALAKDRDVDVVYVATPHAFHKANTLLCLKHKKHVLCEKPLAINASEVTEMIAVARRRGCFLMEAMWTHCFPAMTRLRELIAEGAIGQVRMLDAKFGFRCGWNPDGRLLNRELGGGALLDVGVYVVALAHLVFQRRPRRVMGMAHLGETGVDEQSAMILGYDDGAMATLSCAVRTATPHDATLYGTEGHIRIPGTFWQPDRLVVKRGKAPEETLVFEQRGSGHGYEAANVMACLRGGRLESDVVALDLSLDVITTMDEVRRQWGLTYPME